MSSDKLGELRFLKQKLSGSVKNKASLETEGLIIEILKQITYFKSEAETYGIQVLSYYIPIIEPYMLRAGMQIIDTNQEYVVVEGLVKGTKNDGKLGNLYPDGVLIDPTLERTKPEPERQSLSSSSECDSKLIKIFRNSQDPKLSRYSQTLTKFQKERLSKQREMQRQINSDKNLQTCRSRMSQFQFFQNLTSYDLTELVILSKMLYFKKSSTLHEYGAEANRLGFLMTGQVKIDNSVIHNKQKIVDAGRLLLEKYMVHKKQHNSTVITIAQAGQWIGLQEYLWNESSFLSKAEVVSHDAEVFYVPTQVFSKKFNQLTAFYLMNKLKGLIETKKKLLDKTIKTKKQKQDEILEEKMKIQTLQKLKERLEKNVGSDLQKTKGNKNSKSHVNSHLKKRQTHRHYPSECYMPERLVHKIRTFEQKYESLPKIHERFTLFPEQYEKAMVPLQLREELKMAKEARNPIRNNNNARPFKILSNQKVYQTVIYASLSPRQSTNPETEKKKGFSKLKSNISIDYSQDSDTKFDMLQTIGTVSNISRQRFNSSIFNNFRAPKNKGQKLLENISKTLQII